MTLNCQQHHFHLLCYFQGIANKSLISHCGKLGESARLGIHMVLSHQLSLLDAQTLHIQVQKRVCMESREIHEMAMSLIPVHRVPAAAILNTILNGNAAS